MLKKVFILFILVIPSIHAVDVYIESLQGKGIGVSEKEAIDEFAKSAVQNLSGYQLIPSKNDASIVLIPKLLKVSDTYFLKISKVENGHVIKSLRMKSKQLSDVDRVTERLVESVLKGRTIEDTAKVNNITDAETKKNINRYEVTSQWFFGFGPAWLNNTNISKSGFFWKFGYQWGLDPNFSLKLSYDGVSIDKSSADFSIFQMGLDYYFNLSKTSPYIGFGIGQGRSNVNNCQTGILGISCSGADNKASGWAATVRAGYKFFRTSSVNIGLETEYAYIFDQSRYGNPGRITISLAVYY